MRQNRALASLFERGKTPCVRCSPRTAPMLPPRAWNVALTPASTASGTAVHLPDAGASVRHSSSPSLALWATPTSVCVCGSLHRHPEHAHAFQISMMHTAARTPTTHTRSTQDAHNTLILLDKTTPAEDKLRMSLTTRLRLFHKFADIIFGIVDGG